MQLQVMSESKGTKFKKKDIKQTRAIHLDVYTNELKNLIGKLNDDNLDAVQANSKNKIKRNQQNLDTQIPEMGESNDEEKSQASLIKHAKATDHLKEKL